MNWFYDTFLPSLLERAGTNKGMWLSRKQTAICITVDSYDGCSVSGRLLPPQLLYIGVEREESFLELLQTEWLRADYFWIYTG